MKKIGTLTLQRFNGTEVWDISDGSFSIFQRNGVSHLNFWVASQKLISEPREEIFQATDPILEILTKPERAIDDLEGRKLLVPEYGSAIENEWGEEGSYFSNFYYFGHQNLENMMLEILAHSGDLYTLRFRCRTMDVIYYNGSKPPTEIEVSCVFKLESNLRGFWVYDKDTAASS